MSSRAERVWNIGYHDGLNGRPATRPEVKPYLDGWLQGEADRKEILEEEAELELMLRD